VLSHLGSGAELGLLTIQAGLEDGAAPSRETSLAVWDRGNALSPEAHASGYLEWDSRKVEALVQLTSSIQLADLTPVFPGY
jgi:hypothetical protein